MSKQPNIHYKIKYPNNFEDYYHGPNRKTVNNLEAMLRNKQTVYSFISGDSNSGKSFILQAAVNLTGEYGTAVYLDLSQLIANQEPEVLNQFYKYNLVTLDNFDLITNYDKFGTQLCNSWQYEIFNLIEELKLNNASSLISSEVSLPKLNLNLKDLSSRLAEFQLLYLTPLSKSEISEMILTRAEKIGIQISPKFTEELSAILPSKISAIDTILKRLFDFSSLHNKKLNLRLIEEHPELLLTNEQDIFTLY